VTPGILLDKDAGSKDQSLEKSAMTPGSLVECFLRHLVDFEVKLKIPENRNLRQKLIRKQLAHGIERPSVSPEAIFNIPPTWLVG